MVNLHLLGLYILAVIVVTTAQGYLIVRYLLWPSIQRITHCPWCWKDAGIARDFPAPWSSTICRYHKRQIRIQSSQRRLTRPTPAAAPTKPAIEVVQPQAEEVLV